EVHVLDWPGGTVRRRLRAPVDVWRSSVSPDGRWIAAGCLGGGEAQVWDDRTGEVVLSLTFPWPSACPFEFSPDGRWLVATTWGEYTGFETGTWRRAWAIPRSATIGVGAAFPPDRRLPAMTHSPTRLDVYLLGTADVY